MKKVAILGARGMIGRTLLNILSDYDQALDVQCFGSSENAQVSYKEQTIDTHSLEKFEPANFDVIFSMLDTETTLSLKEKITKSDALWIDKSAAFRMDSDVPLIVAEVNSDAIKGSKIIASPNCVVIPIAMFLHSMESFGVQEIVISTYQSVSGAGMKAMNALFKEAKESFMRPLKTGLFYPDPMIYNVIPYIGAIEEDGFCDEEIKIKQELHKVLQKEFPTSVTVARVPVLIGHTISLTFVLKKKATLDQIEKHMEAAKIVYSPKPLTPIMVASEDDVFACRLRENGQVAAGYSYSVILVSDNLRKGGALNAFEIAELLNAI